MNIIAKLTLGGFALVSFAAAVVPAVAAHATVAIGSPLMREPPPCLRAPAYRPAFCFRRDMRWRAGFWHHLTPAQRMAFVQHRYWGLHR